MSLMEFFYGARIAEAVANKVKGKNKVIDDNIMGGKTKSQKGKKENLEELDEIFQYIEQEANEYVIDQKEYLKALCLGFHRPYLQCSDKSYRNMIFVFGPEGSGRKYAIKVFAKLLSIKRLIKESSIYRLDFAQYDSPEVVGQLLPSDLYKAFYGKSSIVLIDNFNRGCQKALQYIENLGINGSIKLNKRFAWKNGTLVEATGAYEMGTSDSIKANDKYIVLISDQSPAYLEKVFSRSFINSITDVAETRILSSDALCTITDAFLEDCAKQLISHGNIQIDYSGLNQQIIQTIPLKKGVHDISDFIQEKIYSPVIDQYLTGNLNKEETIHLSIYDSAVWGNRIKLSDINNTDSAQELEKLDAELKNIIGLENVKQFIWKLREHIEFNKRNNMDDSGMSLHMVFTGNPGTGKTTIARLVARYLKALGCLSSGHLVETSRADLVAQYMGQTAMKTASVIKSARGGVLFVDEAYSLVRNKEDFFGIEAVDTLVKYMEDYREDLVVIFAGYSQEMNDFMNVNSGLKSRFNYQVDFPDYSPEEMLHITTVLAGKKGYAISRNCNQPLKQYYSNVQKGAKKESGNGRMVRNTVERAILNHSAHLSGTQRTLSKEELYTLTIDDFEIRNPELQQIIKDADTKLANIIGLDEVKKFVTRLKVHVAFEKKAAMSTKLSYHMIFTGNPGTGKTTIARIIAEYMKGLEVLSEGQLIEVSRADLVGGYAGQTAIKTKEVIEKARGGILFIDEAYSLVQNEEDSFGLEAVDTLVKEMEDARNDLIVIMAGYSKEMEMFLLTNSGLSSRFNYKVHFQDYKPEELLAITRKFAAEKKYTIASDCIGPLTQKFERIYNSHSRGNSGNGRLARNLVEKAIFNHSQRMALLTFAFADSQGQYILNKEDFELTDKGNTDYDLENDLSSIIGMEEVKNHIRGIYSLLRVNKARSELGLNNNQQESLHMVFTGNPGTGKTTMARIVEKILFSMEILPSNRFVEADRSSLVAGYVGQTAKKTLEVLEQAKGGVLFIDEAYALANGGENDFGREAIDTIVKYMEDHRDEIVVILAGYTKEMQKFFQMNSGLKSRFPTVIEFPDYTTNELVEIIKQMYQKGNFALGQGTEERLRQIFELARLDPHFGNGRFARNIYEKSLRNQSLRVIKSGVFTRETLMTICPEDIGL